MELGAVFIAGSGSFAAEIADWAVAAGANVLGLIEMRDDRRIGSVRHGLPVVSSEPPHPDARAVLGIAGDRRDDWGSLTESGWAAATIVHPAACLADDVRIGAGVTIGPRAVIGAGSVLGDHVIVNRGALLGHHVDVGDFAALNPGVNIGGNAAIGSDTFIGMGATVVDSVTLGERSLVGAGAVVLRDVKPGTRVQGVPAREANVPAASGSQ